MSSICSAFFAAGSARRFAPLKWPEFVSHLPAAQLRSLTERERSEYERKMLDKKGNVDGDKLLVAKCRLIIMCVVDQNGEPVFREAQIQELMDTDSALTNHLYSQCKKHCGFDEDDIERLVGNSESTTVDDSPSVSL